MEFRPQDIAQLVLGYLKEVHCTTAFHELLNNMESLREHAENYRKSNYIVTRVAGLSLVQYLHEYAAVYTIVQERLEASDYYIRNRSRTSLVKQILYLLDSLDIQSRASTPVPYNKYKQNSDNLITSASSYNEEHIVFEGVHASLDEASTTTTPINRVHNNSSKESSLKKFLNKSIETTTPTADKSTSTDTEIDSKEKSHENCEEIFTNTFLENVGLIEKLANNINKEVSSKSSVELDNLAIESIVQRTESDPILVQLMSELIESPNSIKGNEEEELIVSQNTSKMEPVTSKKNTSLTPTEQSTKRRLRSSKQPHSSCEDTSIDDENKRAVESIIAVSFSSDQPMLEGSSDGKSCGGEMAEVVMSTVQTYNVPASVYTTPSNPNQVYSNTGGLLMIQPSPNISNTSILPQKAVAVDSSKSCYIIGSSPFVNVTIPSTPLKVSSVLSEQDILTMPTIFVCDNNQQYGNSQSLMISTTVPSTSQTTYQSIAPKPMAKSQGISEYLTLYKCNESATPYKISPLKTNVFDKKLIVSQTNSNEAQELKNLAVDDTTEKDIVNSNKLSKDNNSLLIEREKQCEKSPTIIESKERLNWSASKSNSHIRQLDFSTPEMWVSPVKSAKSSGTKLRNNEKPKKSNNKTVRTTLFKSPVPEDVVDQIDEKGIDSGEPNAVIENSKTIKNPESTWDANLRNFQVMSPVRSVPERNKRKKVDDSEVCNAKKMKENTIKIEDSSPSLETGGENEHKNSESTEHKSSTPSTIKRIIKKKTPKSSSAKKRSSSKKSKKKKNSDVTSKKDYSNEKDTETKDNVNVDVKNEDLLNKEYVMMDRIGKPRINKKCNMENVKKNSVLDEVVLTNVPKIKSCEVLGEGESNLILSTKLSSKKGTKKDNSRIVVQQNVVLKCSNIDFRSSKSSENAPEGELNASADQIPKCYSLPTLQTPIKNDNLLVPKTPCPMASDAIDTPFTKAVIDQLTEVDINSIHTPKFPITPSFAFTPAIRHSPFANRGTDYSTSSSYYQPSDSEQNKSLEQLIQECHILEKHERDDNLEEDESLTEAPVTNGSEKQIQKECNETEEKDEMCYPNQESDVNFSQILVEKRKAFNQNMLGQKNMQLVKMLADENESSSECCSSNDESSFCDSDNDNHSNDSESKDSAAKVSHYSLRPRKTSILSSQTYPKTVTKKSEGIAVRKANKPTSFKGDVLQKMEEVRQRTIAMFKSGDSSRNNKTTVKPKPIHKVRRKSAMALKKEQGPKCENLKTEPMNSADNSKLTPALVTDQSKKLKSLTNVTEDSTKSINISTVVKEKQSTNSIAVKETNDDIQRADCNLDNNFQSNDLKVNKKKTRLLSVEKKLPDHQISCNLDDLKINKNESVKLNVELKLSEKQKDSDLDDLKVDKKENMKINVESTVPDKQISSKLDTKVDEKLASAKVSNDALTENKKLAIEIKNITLLEEEEDIVLHLSSDDDKLEPFEMVETELLECSTSFTPTCEHTKEITDLWKNEKPEDEAILDKKAETLVNELKQWGIHLIPNKQVKSTPVVAEQKEKKTVKNKSNVKDAQAVVEMLNSSLEEGEIKTPEKENIEAPRPKKKTDNLKRSDSKSSSKKLRSHSSNTNHSQPKKKEIPALKKMLSHSSKELNNKSEMYEKQKPRIVENERFVEKRNLDIQFDIKTYEKETLTITFDDSLKPSRKLSDYNFDILNKQFSANVYIDEIESEVEKLMTCTPFNVILDIPGKYCSIDSKKSANTELKPLVKKKKSLHIICSTLMKSEGKIYTSSPLQNLYSPELNTRDRQINRNLEKEKTVSIRNDQPEKHRKERPPDCTPSGEFSEYIKSNDRNKKHKKEDKSDRNVKHEKSEKPNKEEIVEEIKEKTLLEHKHGKNKKNVSVEEDVLREKLDKDEKLEETKDKSLVDHKHGKNKKNVSVEKDVLREKLDKDKKLEETKDKSLLEHKHGKNKKTVRVEEDILREKLDKDEKLEETKDKSLLEHKHGKNKKNVRVEEDVLREKLDKGDKLEETKDKILHEDKYGKNKQNVTAEEDILRKLEAPNENVSNKCIDADIQRSDSLDDLWTKRDSVQNEDDGIKNSEDDLMNYAAVGSERISNDDYDFSSEKRKRKTSTGDHHGNQEEKKQKSENCRELLQSIDVDVFLKHLHGDQ